MTGATRPRILIVDDDPTIRRLMVALLSRAYELREAASGEEALAHLAEFVPDVTLLDIILPEMDGYEVCRRIKAPARSADVQVIMVSGRSAKEEQLWAYEAGADDYFIKPFDAHDLVARVQLHVQLRQAKGNVSQLQSEIESRNHELRQLAEQRAQEIIATQDVAVFMMARLAESRDEDTGAHLFRIRAYSQVLAEQLTRSGTYTEQIDQRFLDDLYRSSPLHDIGKVGIRDDILLKPGRLTPEEFDTMKQHTIIGAKVLEEAGALAKGGFLSMAAQIARYHHERFNGRGYPTRLGGTAIPLPARIVALADVYDALTSARPYKVAYPPARARAMIELESGQHFDPRIVAAFHARFSDFLAIQARTNREGQSSAGALLLADDAAPAQTASLECV